MKKNSKLVSSPACARFYFLPVLSLLFSAFTYAQTRTVTGAANQPNPYPGKEITGPFIRRLSYTTSEISVNTANVQAAIARQGADNLETRIWRNKPWQ